MLDVQDVNWLEVKGPKQSMEDRPLASFFLDKQIHSRKKKKTSRCLYVGSPTQLLTYLLTYKQ